MVSQTLKKGAGGSLQFGLKLRGGRGRPLPWIHHCICHLHISHNAAHLPATPPPPPPPKFCITFFSFRLGNTAIPCEIENNAYAKFFFGWGDGRGANKVYYGRCVSGVFSNLKAQSLLSYPNHLDHFKKSSQNVLRQSRRSLGKHL